jgi:ABC-2 type transport system ATP-binding protein
MTAGIDVEGVCKSFRGAAALTGVDLSVDAGEIVALLGRNGAGKSTLLRVLGTTVLADSGRATVAGFDVDSQAPSVRRHTGVVLGDERSWYWRLSGRANLEFFAAMYGLRRSAARRRTAELLEFADLEDRADDRFDGYSAGMRARLSLARALLTEPAVLLLDEPTRTLDPVAAMRFRLLLRDLADSQRAILWVTHDLHEAADVADRVLLMDRGRIAVERSGTHDARELESMVVTGSAR